MPSSSMIISRSVDPYGSKHKEHEEHTGPVGLSVHSMIIVDSLTNPNSLSRSFKGANLYIHCINIYVCSNLSFNDFNVRHLQRSESGFPKVGLFSGPGSSSEVQVDDWHSPTFLFGSPKGRAGRSTAVSGSSGPLAGHPVRVQRQAMRL